MIIEYETWVENIMAVIDRPSMSWDHIGIYAFPTKHNFSFSERIIHYCYEYWALHTRSINGTDDTERVNSFNFHKCDCCGKDTPDGIKMIALLAKL